MNKEDTINSLNSLESDLKHTKKLLASTKASVISGESIRKPASRVARKWFEELEKTLSRYDVAEPVISKYHNLFDKLLSLSLKVSVRKTYIRTISDILKDFRTELLAPVMKSAGPVLAIAQLDKIFENVSDDEKDYLTEAVECAGHGHLRASIVLGWNAAVHRIHKVIEKLGFDQFNKKSEEMKKVTEGRFKRFNKSFNVTSLSELRASVFDNDLLWVLEYWGLIDAGQHERLSLCFTMRNNCAHPGEAPLTEENLASFYSDLKYIILDNPKFKL